MAITLAGQSLPTPTTQPTKYARRGKGRRMANGAVKFQYVESSAKEGFTLTWPALTSAQKSTLETAYDTLTASSSTYIDHNSVSRTVTLDEANMILTTNEIKAAGSNRWQCSIALVEA